MKRSVFVGEFQRKINSKQQIALPARFIEIGVTKPGDDFGINFNRERYAGTKVYSCWSCTYGGFHSPKRFGKLVFGQSVARVEVDLGKRSVGKNTLELMVKNVGQVPKDLAAEIEFLKGKKERKKLALGVGEQKSFKFDYELKAGKETYLILSVLDVSGWKKIVLWRTGNLPLQPVK